MSRSKKVTYSLFILISVVGLILLLSSIIVFRIMEPDQTTSFVQNFSNSVSFVGPITFGLVGSNSTEVTAAAGSIVHGTMTINIFQAAPLRFFIDDRGYNTSIPTLPTGISISLGIYGKSYDPLFFSNPDSMVLSNIPLVSTTIGETTIQYTVNVASAVPKGTYNLRILCQSFLNNGNLTDQGEYYEVILYVK